MMCSATNQLLIQHIQNDFFNLLTNSIGCSYEKFIIEVADILKTQLDVPVVSVYLRKEGQEAYRLYSNLPDVGLELKKCFLIEQTEGSIRDLIVQSFTSLDVRVIPLEKNSKTIGYIVFGFEAFHCYKDRLLGEISIEVVKCLSKAEFDHNISDEKTRYELLYNLTSKFNSSTDMNMIIRETIRTLKDNDPGLTYTLWLSQDISVDRDLPVKELSYDYDLPLESSSQAFMTGKMQIEGDSHNGPLKLYAPLKGKQGVYGVLEVLHPFHIHLPKKECDLVELIGSTVGDAIENVQLYQQSRKLNSDLQLINSTSQKLNSNTRLTEKISYMSSTLAESFQADEVGFVTFNECNHDENIILEGSSPYFETADSQLLISMVKQRVHKEKDDVFIGNLSSKNNKYCEKYKSIMAVRMTDYEQLDGLAIVLHKQSYFFSFDSFKLLQSLIHHSTLAFANSMLREELEKTVVTDYLTKLHSRNYLDKCVEGHTLNDKCGTFILFDIDNFKGINDTYGHQKGDEVLCQTAEAIQSALKGRGMAARWGGEELAVYIPGMICEEAFQVADSIRREIFRVTSPSVTVSCGVSSWNANQPSNGKELVRRADEALYKAKEAGKNQIVMAETT
ncbi:diguanylate cyclase (GGDEF) domain-containing protein [Halobacillus alkaliphilus]|uniref:Diguanylate cyclase (GGDEF) domain-containing protein n=1 Tax=Halobacillus alkaliphilus TaxID=396056 RepID=A0A1I2SKV8_9BACI|nr:sensor domain-containing diguanylate cyclase [Halobacillus alkaliphilus]SFG52369.1 diguanylate cyclase (GGDEF) domain-containing protein [Halobacillus alkaliphilus]